MKHHDIELGDEPIQVERKPRAGAVISARLTAEEADQLQEIAESLGKTLSQLAREVLSEFLRSGQRSGPRSAPWTGTTNGSANLVLTFGDHSSMPRTSGPPTEQVVPPTALGV